MFSLLIFSSLFALTLAQQCPANPGGGPILYPALAAKNVSIGETPPKGVGIEGWLLVPSSLIDAAWGDAGYPYGEVIRTACSLSQLDGTSSCVRSYTRTHTHTHTRSAVPCSSPTIHGTMVRYVVILVT